MTTSVTNTVARELNKGDPNTVPSLAKKMKWGNMMNPIKVVVASLTATATPDITAAATLAAATVTGIDLDDGENLPAIGKVVSLRCSTSGTANSVGTYIVGDSNSTALSPTAGANVGIAELSDDGTTLTFPTTVTGFEIHYYPRPAADFDDAFPET